MGLSRRSLTFGGMLLPCFPWSTAQAARAGFNYRNFLKVVTNDEAAFRHFTRIATEKTEFLEFYDLTNIEYRTLSPQTVKAKSLVAAMVKEGWAFNFDWAGETEAFFVHLATLLRKRRSGLDASALSEKATVYNAQFENVGGQHVGRIYGPVAEALETESLLLAYINDTSDSYFFFILPRNVMSDWIGKKLDPDIEIVHPGRDFAGTLKGSPYARYSHEALRLGKRL